MNHWNTLRKREGYYIREIGTLNHQIAGRTTHEYDKEYYEDNKDTIKQINKEYREANKDKISQAKKEYYEANKDKKTDNESIL